MPSARSQRLLLTLVGVLASGAFIALAIRHLDASATFDALRRARLLPWVPLGIAAYLAGHLVRGQRLRLLVRREATLALGTASSIVVAGYASNNVLPLRLGELVRAGLLAERTGIPITQSLTVTFIERVLDGITILILLLASAFGSGHANSIAGLTRIGPLVLAVGLAVLLLGVLLPNTLLGLVSRATVPLGPRTHALAIRVATNVINGGECLRRPRQAVAIFGLSALVWSLEAMMFVLILPALSLAPQLSTGIVAMSVTNLGILVPSTSPGSVVGFHFWCSQALVSQGVAEPTAVAYAVLVHLAFYVPVTLWGAGAVVWYGAEIGGALALARKAKASPKNDMVLGVRVHPIADLESAPPRTRTTEFYMALAEAILPNARIPKETVNFTATFVKDEMEALPPRLRVMFELGMTTFRAYVRVRYLRSFCALSPDRRRAAVESWAFGPIALFRQLFRPVRSTALVAYYELPEALIGTGDG